MSTRSARLKTGQVIRCTGLYTKGRTHNVIPAGEVWWGACGKFGTIEWMNISDENDPALDVWHDHDEFEIFDEPPDEYYVAAAVFALIGGNDDGTSTTE
jgi:hypothetical protein